MVNNMEKELIKKNNDDLKKEYKKDDIDLAYQFAADLHKEAGKFVKGVILFGSKARKKKIHHDIDILVIMDDISVEVTKEFVQTYRIIVQNLVAKISTKLHITTFKLTSFWELLRKGDPIAINILRDGVPIIDTELFRPMQVLLYQGRIKPSKEALWAYLYKSTQTMQNSRLHLIKATIDLYWAVIDAAESALMTVHAIPPSPEHVAELMHEKLVKTNLLDKKYVDLVMDFYVINKQIETREIKFVTGKDYDKYFKKAEEFIGAIKILVNKQNK
ncbi:nucleotidyltransferase domain-containing protein [archaeon]|jgi:predicted nucleotidyltransferase|nr:nucleotidyltransferase domain-containing protein [archaeon]MBT4648502.1 nucleotidyltransferase domain-containing protein [archaeon]MBT6820835.1 nucleotidyltransferase domain-containing protein [archaeon]